MPVPDNDKSDAREQWLDDLLTADREHLQRTAEDRIAGGMYPRILQAGAGREHGLAKLWRWGLISAAAAVIMLMIWLKLPQKAHPSTEVASPPGPGPTPAALIITRAAGSHAAPPRPKLMRLKTSAQAIRNFAPKPAVFPSNIVPTEEERLLLQLANGHPEQLKELSEAISEMDKREKERRQAFEKWQEKGEEP